MSTNNGNSNGCLDDCKLHIYSVQAHIRISLLTSTINSLSCLKATEILLQGEHFPGWQPLNIARTNLYIVTLAKTRQKGADDLKNIMATIKVGCSSCRNKMQRNEQDLGIILALLNQNNPDGSANSMDAVPEPTIKEN